MSKLKQLFSQGKPIPLLILLLGVLLMSGGFYTAISSNTVIIDFRTVLVYPLLFQGALEILFGVAVAVFGYLLFHGKIGYFNST